MDIENRLPKVVTFDDTIDLTKITAKQYESLLKVIQGIEDPLTVEFALRTPAGCEERLLKLFEILSQKSIEHLYIYNCNFQEVNNIPQILAHLGKMRHLKTLDVGGSRLFSCFWDGQEAFGIDRWNAFLEALNRLNALEALCLHEHSVLSYLKIRKENIKALFDMLEKKSTLKIVSFAGITNSKIEDFIMRLLIKHPNIRQVECASLSILPGTGWTEEDERNLLAPKEYGDEYVNINAEREARQLPKIEFCEYDKTDIRNPLDNASSLIMIDFKRIEEVKEEVKEMEQTSPRGTPSSRNSSPVSSTSSTSSVLSEDHKEALPLLSELNIPKTDNKKVDVK